MNQADPSSQAQNFKEFQIDDTLADVPGKMLSPPAVRYGAGAVKVQNASWDLRDVKKFVTNGKAQKFPVLVLFDGSRGDAQAVAAQQSTIAQTWVEKSLVPQMQRHGWPGVTANSFAYRQCEIAPLDTIDDRLKALTQKAKETGSKLILVVLWNDSKQVYGAVKRAGDLYAGIPTSCVLSQKIQKLSPQVSLYPTMNTISLR